MTFCKKGTLRCYTGQSYFWSWSLLAAVFGFGGIAGTAAGFAKILFVIFLIMFVVSLVFGRTRTPVV